MTETAQAKIGADTGPCGCVTGPCYRPIDGVTPTCHENEILTASQQAKE